MGNCTTKLQLSDDAFIEIGHKAQKKDYSGALQTLAPLHAHRHRYDKTSQQRIKVQMDQIGLELEQEQRVSQQCGDEVERQDYPVPHRQAPVPAVSHVVQTSLAVNNTNNNNNTQVNN